MTAQIAIMNRNAVALATDSAVTTRNAHGVKVHNSANKLFTVSKYHPIGIMVHANADFMGYPWETLIKVFRRRLGGKSFNTLKEYADSFFDFLLEQQDIFSPERQDQWFKGQVVAILSAVNEAFKEHVRRHIDQNGPVDDMTVKALFEAMLIEVEKSLSSAKSWPVYEDQANRTNFYQRSAAIIRAAIPDVFQSLPIESYYERIVSVIQVRMTSDTALNYSGIVFAGFGEKEMLPVVESYWVDGVFAGVVRRAPQQGLSQNLNTAAGSWIFPFAQSDSVYRFLNGIDPNYKNTAFSHIGELIDAVCDHVRASAFHLHDTEEKRDLADKELKDVSDREKDRLAQRLSQLERETFISPVVEVVDGLPKDDLAAMAESLVNLTSFQRKILRETETVGGPIDVAVISKGDGFVWIKRKHYFDKDLNPSFFANYYRGDGNEDEREDNNGAPKRDH